MKFILESYLEYLEVTIISLILASLAIISIAGLSYGNRGILPAVLAIVILASVFLIALSRRKTAAKHPELRGRPFREIKLFLLTIEEKAVKLPRALNLASVKLIQRFLGRIIVIAIAGFIIVPLWLSFSISADIAALKKDQARVVLDIENSATLFNRSVIIRLIQASPENNEHPAKVTAVIMSEGYPEMRIEDVGIGYETIYNGVHPYRIQVLEVNDSEAKFFVGRLPD